MTIYLLIDELHDQIKFLIKCTDEYVSIWKQQLFNQKKKMHLKEHTVDVEVKHVNKNISIAYNVKLTDEISINLGEKKI